MPMTSYSFECLPSLIYFQYFFSWKITVKFIMTFPACNFRKQKEKNIYWLWERKTPSNVFSQDLYLCFYFSSKFFKFLKSVWGILLHQIMQRHFDNQVHKSKDIPLKTKLTNAFRQGCINLNVMVIGQANLHCWLDQLLK